MKQVTLYMRSAIASFQTGMVFLAIFFYQSLSAQKIDTVKILLSQGSYKHLEHFLEENKQANVAAPIKRQIIDDYSEVVIDLEESLKIKNVFNVNEYKINIVTDKDSIVYYNLSDVSNPKKTFSIKSFSNDSRLDFLWQSYLITYRTTISLSDFFTDKVIYGIQCGFAIKEPEYRKALNNAVKNNKPSDFDKWLCSAVTEVQVYAVDGLFQLKQAGYTPTAEELRLIHIIKKKQGNIRTCSSDNFSTETIKEATKKFTF